MCCFYLKPSGTSSALKPEAPAKLSNNTARSNTVNQATKSPLSGGLQDKIRKFEYCTTNNHQNDRNDKNRITTSTFHKEIATEPCCVGECERLSERAASDSNNNSEISDNRNSKLEKDHGDKSSLK